MRALFCEQVSDSRIRPTGCLFVYYFFEWVYLRCLALPYYLYCLRLAALLTYFFELV